LKNILGLVAGLLPQVMLLLLLGGRLDLLGGWNNTDAASGTLMLLFIVTPLVAAAWWIVELLAYRVSGKAGLHPSPGRVWLAATVLVESLAIDLFILSQLRMH
jgi:hypothetical protein